MYLLLWQDNKKAISAAGFIFLLHYGFYAAYIVGLCVAAGLDQFFLGLGRGCIKGNPTNNYNILVLMANSPTKSLFDLTLTFPF